MNIIREVENITRRLPGQLNNYVDYKYPIPSVFGGTGDIKLIILGQDPTVKNPASRKNIRVVLNLDKKQGRLYRYLNDICIGLGLDLEKNVYATNYFKNFFISPPNQIKEISIFNEFTPYFLPLLKEELEEFQNIPVIALGQPLLKEMALWNASPRVRDYWGYKPKWKSGERGNFCLLEPRQNTLERVIFPFPHQPSIGKQFYDERKTDYIKFSKNIIHLGD